MIIIGEKINGSIPIVAEAIAKRDSEFIKARAKLQAESGATLSLIHIWFIILPIQMRCMI